MSDERVRGLERRWRETGDPQDGAAYLQERVRAGGLAQDRLELVAYLGDPAALCALGLEVGQVERLPSRLFQAGASLRPWAGTTIRVRDDGEDPTRREFFWEAVTLDSDLSVRGTFDSTFETASAVTVRNLVLETCSVGCPRVILNFERVTRYSNAMSSVFQLAGRRGGPVDLINLTPGFREGYDRSSAGKKRPVRVHASEADALRDGHLLEPPAEPSDLEWIERLARWGPEVCVRAALANARGVVAPAAQAWLDCPCEEHQDQAYDALHEPDRSNWHSIATKVAATGHWPAYTNRLWLAPAIDRDAVREALVAWALS